MAQTQVISGLGIDTAFPTGQLSLHDYRKLLSQQDDGIQTPLSPPPRLLKRKQAAVNLCQAQQYQHHYYHHPDFAAFHYNHLQSPVSSAPSSPPPLSFSQSVISLHGDLPTPISPASINRPFSQPLSSVTRRMVGFHPPVLFSQQFLCCLLQTPQPAACSFSHPFYPHIRHCLFLERKVFMVDID